MGQREKQEGIAGLVAAVLILLTLLLTFVLYR